jgi:hypothetical protein
MQGRPVADDPGLDEEVVLVGQVHGVQLPRQADAAEERTVRRPILEVLHRGAQVTGQVRAAGQEKSCRVVEATYFGLASSFSAHVHIATGASTASLATAGQWSSISS